MLVLSRPREPHYEGQSLTYWAARLNQPEAQQALTAIGTNALPFLIKWLDEEPTRFGSWTWKIGQRLPESIRPDPWPFGSRRDIAGNALGFLGTNAILAIPELIRTFDWNWGGGSPPHGQYALAEIGPAAVPALLEALEEDSERGFYVVATLFYMGEPHWQGPRTIQELREILAAINRLADYHNQDVRYEVARRLFWLDKEGTHDEVVRVWVKLLRDESPDIRAAAVKHARLLPPDSPQLDLLLPLRDDPDAEVRAAVERVLQKAGRLGPMPAPVAPLPKP